MPTSAIYRACTIGMLATMLAVPFQSNAQHGYTQRDRALLPPYCKYTPGERLRAGTPEGNDAAEIKRWNRLLGTAFIGLHHYCWGLIATNKARVARTQQERLHYLQMSIGEFDYVLRNSDDDFVLRPEILTKKGENLIRLKEYERAIPELVRAIEAKPDYWPAYAAMGDCFRDAGEPAKAREWLQKGLSVAPGVKTLEKRLADLNAYEQKRK